MVGSLTKQLHLILSLVFLGLFAFTIFSYINANAQGEHFYSKVYAIDIATSAEVVNAGYGDVLLRYDNLKPNLDLAFLFTNGKVSIVKPLSSYLVNRMENPRAIGSIDDREVKRTREYNSETSFEVASPFFDTKTIRIPSQLWESLATAHEYYGVAKEYPLERAALTPHYLSLRKIDESFSITQADEAIATCPVIIPTEGTVGLAITGELTDEQNQKIKQAFVELSNQPLLENADIMIHVDINVDTRNEITAAPTNEHGQRYFCFFTRQLTTLTLLEFNDPLPQQGEEFIIAIKLTLSNKDVIREEHIGHALAQALGRYYE
ncbi:MAG: hypothetical protein OXR66_06020 [Candidatus Woesearchaeota archaeon]|nr:hypothetical protein [Candidatus Woesearchaeota archaeon]